MFICISIPKHNTCNDDVNGKVNVAFKLQRPTLLVSLDLSAASDMVNHATLLKRLSCSFGVNGKVSVALCNAVKLLLLWCHMGNKFREFGF